MKFKVATYNLWNHPGNQRSRLNAAAEELKLLAADVIALQEAPATTGSGEPFGRLFRHSGYSHAVHSRYPGPPEEGTPPEGLGFLSRSQLTEVRPNWSGQSELAETANNWAVTAHLEIENTLISITNVHLDWRSPESRLRGLQKILDGLDTGPLIKIQIVCGDFNDDGPSVTAMSEAQSAQFGPWRDVVAELFEAQESTPPPTLDPATNPRWRNSPQPEPASRVDRIYVRSALKGNEPELLSAGLFARYPDNHLELVPSDHYGVYVELELIP